MAIESDPYAIDSSSWPHSWDCPECDRTVKGLTVADVRERVREHANQCFGGRP